MQPSQVYKRTRTPKSLSTRSCVQVSALCTELLIIVVAHSKYNNIMPIIVTLAAKQKC